MYSGSHCRGGDARCRLRSTMAALPDKLVAAIQAFLPAYRARMQQLCDLNEVFVKLKQARAAGEAGGDASVLWDEAQLRGRVLFRF